MEAFRVNMPIWSVVGAQIEEDSNELILKLESCTKHRINVRIDIEKMEITDYTKLSFGPELASLVLEKIERIKERRAKTSVG